MYSNSLNWYSRYQSLVIENKVHHGKVRMAADRRGFVREAVVLV
jgi:hypothetical protein